MQIEYNSQIELIDNNNIENSLLLKVAKHFFEFPDNLHDFKIINDYNLEYFIEIEFYNYRKTHCTILYHYKTNEVRFKKGIGGLNINKITLTNLLIELNIWHIKN